MKKCKTKIAASFGLGVQCDHCRLRFCMNHGLPEVHGCGDAARKAARQHLVQDGKIFAGTDESRFNPIPTGHGRNQPIYERHVTKSGRNRVKIK